MTKLEELRITGEMMQRVSNMLFGLEWVFRGLCDPETDWDWIIEQHDYMLEMADGASRCAKELRAKKWLAEMIACIRKPPSVKETLDKLTADKGVTWEVTAHGSEIHAVPSDARILINFDGPESVDAEVIGPGQLRLRGGFGYFSAEIEPDDP